MVDQWTPPEGATPQQYAGAPNPRDGNKVNARILRQIKEQLRDMPGHLLQQAGIRVEPGKLIIEGDLEVPNGSIKNAYLESPIDVNFARYDDNGWPLTTSWTTVASGALTVPTGYGRVDLVANTHAGAYNDTASIDYLRVRTVIQGTNGLALPERVAAGTYGTAHSSDLYREDGLSGGTISVEIQVRCDFASWSASASNQASTDVFAVFRRS